MRNFFILLLIISSYILKAQDEEVKLKLRHLAGFRAIDANAGLNKYGYQLSLGYSQYESEKFIARIVLNSEFGKIDLTSYNTNTLFIEFDHTLFKLKDLVFFNAGYGVLAGWESTSNDVLKKKTDALSYGILVDVNSEIYVLNRLALLIEFKEIWDNGSSFGQFRYYANTGLRYYL